MQTRHFYLPIDEAILNVSHSAEHNRPALIRESVSKNHLRLKLPLYSSNYIS